MIIYKVYLAHSSAVQAWYQHLLGSWEGLRKLLLMTEGEQGAGTSHDERGQQLPVSFKQAAFKWTNIEQDLTHYKDGTKPSMTDLFPWSKHFLTGPIFQHWWSYFMRFGGDKISKLYQFIISQRVKTIHMSTNGRMDKQNVAQTYNGILFSQRREWILIHVTWNIKIC